MRREAVVNALTVDVEDYYQVSAFEGSISRTEWERMPQRVVANTERLLAMFELAGVRGTFFVLGWVAERYPELVRRIAQCGHEIACHGYSHRLIYHQSPKEFREETLKAKTILEEITGQPITGYRAASYSITRRSLWALDILSEAGFLYDSSIFPVHHDTYGMPGSPTVPHRLEAPGGGRLLEFPLSSVGFDRFRIPVAGGGYFRLLPYRASRAAFRLINGGGRPFVFYLHPWEIDPEQPRIDAPWRSRARHYLNLARTSERLRQLLRDFEFAPMTEVLERAELPSDEVQAVYGPA